MSNRKALQSKESSRNTRARFEQWAKNPGCEANTISAVHNIQMSMVATQESGTRTMGQSPFAIARGKTFERSLFRDDAKRIKESLRDAGVIHEGESVQFHDFRMKMDGGTKYANLDEARVGTLALLRRIPVDPMEPTVLLCAGAVVSVPGGYLIPEAILVIDILLLRTADRKAEAIIGEAKTFPDRGGYTDGGQLGSARAQAGVYVHGMRLVLDDSGLSSEISVSDEGFLVLTRPGFNSPRIRAKEDFKYQAERAKRGFAQLKEVAHKLHPIAEEAKTPTVVAAQTEYGESCISFCDRASTCQKAALKSGKAEALGDDMRRFLGEVSLTRALGMLAGKVKPENDAERDLHERLVGASGVHLGPRGKGSAA